MWNCYSYDINPRLEFISGTYRKVGSGKVGKNSNIVKSGNSNIEIADEVGFEKLI